ncbi:MAG: amidase [Alphaproteobacteria bacterium]
MSKPWHEMTALELGAAIGAGAVDPVELAEHFLDRIAEADPEHKIYLRTTAERARAEALSARARARSDRRRGALDGVPLSWKDLYDTAGVVTCMASPLLEDRVPDRDAEVLARATRAGMVCLGKTNLVEFAFGALGINPTFGTPENPFDDRTSRCPGGSTSGGAVSVVRGLAPAAMGSDTGGSVRVPAAWNGLVGLKPTHGLLPLEGVLPLAPSRDTPGPLTRDVADAGAIFAVIAEREPANLEQATLDDARLLVPRTIVDEHVAPGISHTFERALERLTHAGARLSRAEVPEFAEVDEMMQGPNNVIAGEAARIWAALVATAPERVYGPVARRLLGGKELSEGELAARQEKFRRLKASYLRRTADFDAVVVPTVLIPPPLIAALEDGGEAYVRTNFHAILTTRLGNQLSLCALTVPCGRDDEGLPVGLMLMCRPYGEVALLRLGRAAEKALGS